MQDAYFQTGYSQSSKLQNGEDKPEIKLLTQESQKLRVDFYISAGSFHKELRRIGSLHQIVVGTGSKYVASGFDKETLFSSGSLGFSHLLAGDDSLRLRYLDETGKIQYDHVFSK